MSKLGFSLLGVSILSFVPGIMRAQESAPPKVLTITREFVSPTEMAKRTRKPKRPSFRP